MPIGLIRWLGAAALLLSSLIGSSHAQECAAPTNQSPIALSGKPFSLKMTNDRCWLFVSLAFDGDQGGLEVLRNDRGQLKIFRTINFPGEAHGLALAEDIDLLAVATEHNVLLLNLPRLETLDEEPSMGSVADGKSASYMEVIVSVDRRTLFASEEQFQRIGVFDLAIARANHYQSFEHPNHIPTGVAPVGLALSPDGSTLYSVSQAAPPSP